MAVIGFEMTRLGPAELYDEISVPLAIPTPLIRWLAASLASALARLIVVVDGSNVSAVPTVLHFHQMLGMQ